MPTEEENDIAGSRVEMLRIADELELLMARGNDLVEILRMAAKKVLTAVDEALAIDDRPRMPLNATLADRVIMWAYDRMEKTGRESYEFTAADVTKVRSLNLGSALQAKLLLVDMVMTGRLVDISAKVRGVERRRYLVSRTVLPKVKLPEAKPPVVKSLTPSDEDYWGGAGYPPDEEAREWTDADDAALRREMAKERGERVRPPMPWLGLPLVNIGTEEEQNARRDMLKELNGTNGAAHTNGVSPTVSGNGAIMKHLAPIEPRPTAPEMMPTVHEIPPNNQPLPVYGDDDETLTEDQAVALWEASQAAWKAEEEEFDASLTASDENGMRYDDD